MINTRLQPHLKTPSTAMRIVGISGSFLGMLIVALLLASTANAATSKEATLKALRDWRGRIVAEDEKSASEQKKRIVSLSKISFRSAKNSSKGDEFSSQLLEQELEIPLTDIQKLDSERVELEARRRIVDQLIFTIDTGWSGADLRSFLEGKLLDLAVTDLSEPGQGGWWRFLIQASISLRETAEPGADPIRFLEAYTSESGVLEPKSALEVLKSRDYIGN